MPITEQQKLEVAQRLARSIHYFVPQLSEEQKEDVRIWHQKCCAQDLSSAPPCNKGLPTRPDLKCDCAPIKKQYGLHGVVCMANLPCPVRKMAGIAERA